MARIHVFTPIVLVLISTATVTAQEAKNQIPESAEAILRNGESFELVLLNPAKKGDYYGWKVEKKLLIKDPATRKKIVDELKQAVANSDGIASREFKKPRFGLNVTHDGKTAQLIISFEEDKAIVFIAGKQVNTVRLTNSPAKLLDTLLKE